MHHFPVLVSALALARGKIPFVACRVLEAAVEGTVWRSRGLDRLVETS